MVDMIITRIERLFPKLRTPAASWFSVVPRKDAQSFVSAIKLFFNEQLRDFVKRNVPLAG